MPFRVPASLFLFIAACSAMVLLGYAAFLVGPVNPSTYSSAVDSILLPNTIGVFPEREYVLFIAVLVLVPIVLAGLAIGLRGEIDSPEPMFWAIVSTTLLILAFRGDVWKRIFISSWLLAFMMFAWRCFLHHAGRCFPRTFHSWTVLGLFIASLLLVVLQQLWTPGSLTYSGPINSHYEAVTSSIVRIATGGTCLADVIAQYGCYGEFVSPVLKIFGGNITVITSLFAVLLIIAIRSATNSLQRLSNIRF